MNQLKEKCVRISYYIRRPRAQFTRKVVVNLFLSAPPNNSWIYSFGNPSINVPWSTVEHIDYTARKSQRDPQTIPLIWKPCRLQASKQTGKSY